MLSTVRRYKALVSGALSRCFPRTTAYLKSEDDALFRRWPKAAETGAGKREATAKPGAPRRKGKKATAEKRPQPTNLAVDAAHAVAQVSTRAKRWRSRLAR